MSMLRVRFVTMLDLDFETLLDTKINKTQF